MGFLNRIKRFLNKTTGGATLNDYALNETTLGKLVDDIERMITVYNDIFGDIVVSGGLEANRVGLVNDITKCLVYAKKRRVEQDVGVTGHTYTISKDTYVHLNTLTGIYTFNEVANAAGAPALGADEIAIIKVVTDGTVITGTTDLSVRTINSTPSIAGTVLDSALSSNVALLNGTAPFTADGSLERKNAGDTTGIAFNRLAVDKYSVSVNTNDDLTQQDVTKKSMELGLRLDIDRLQLVTRPAGGARVDAISWDTSVVPAKMVTGTIPLARMIEIQQDNTSGSTPRSVTFGSVGVGDIIQVFTLLAFTSSGSNNFVTVDVTTSGSASVGIEAGGGGQNIHPPVTGLSYTLNVSQVLKVTTAGAITIQNRIQGTFTSPTYSQIMAIRFIA